MSDPTCFVAMPLSTRPHEADRYQDDDHWANVFEYLITPALTKAGFTVWAPGRVGSEHITSQIVRDICSADLMLCDLSSANANVFFELGLRTSLNLPVAIMHDQFTRQLPFDVHAINSLTYRFKVPIDGMVEALRRHVIEARRTSANRNTLWGVYGAEYTAQRDGKIDELQQNVRQGRQEIDRLRENLKEMELLEGEVRTLRGRLSKVSTLHAELEASRDRVEVLEQSLTNVARASTVLGTPVAPAPPQQGSSGSGAKVSVPNPQSAEELGLSVLEVKRAFLSKMVDVMLDLVDEERLVFLAQDGRTMLTILRWGISVRVIIGPKRTSIPRRADDLRRLIEPHLDVLNSLGGGVRVERVGGKGQRLEGSITSSRDMEILGTLIRAWLEGAG